MGIYKTQASSFDLENETLEQIEARERRLEQGRKMIMEGLGVKRYSLYVLLTDENDFRGPNVIIDMMSDLEAEKLGMSLDNYVKVGEYEDEYWEGAKFSFCINRFGESYFTPDYNQYNYKLENGEIVPRTYEETEPDRYASMPSEFELQAQQMKLIKANMDDYLKNNYIEFKGERYPIDYESQTEMANLFTDAQITMAMAADDEYVEPTVSWHTYKGPPKELSINDFMELFMEIKKKVQPVIDKKNEMKAHVYSLKNKYDIQNTEVGFRDLKLD